MMLLSIIIISVLVFINPILGVLGVYLCLGLFILKSVIFGDKDDKKNRKHDDTPYTEYDEFDRWQDNQGF